MDGFGVNKRPERQSHPVQFRSGESRFLPAFFVHCAALSRLGECWAHVTTFASKTRSAPTEGKQRDIFSPLLTHQHLCFVQIVQVGGRTLPNAERGIQNARLFLFLFFFVAILQGVSHSGRRGNLASRLRDALAFGQESERHTNKDVFPPRLNPRCHAQGRILAEDKENTPPFRPSPSATAATFVFHYAKSADVGATA